MLVSTYPAQSPHWAPGGDPEEPPLLLLRCQSLLSGETGRASLPLRVGSGMVRVLGGWRDGNEDGDSLSDKGIWEGLLEEVAFPDGP